MLICISLYANIRYALACSFQIYILQKKHISGPKGGERVYENRKDPCSCLSAGFQGPEIICEPYRCGCEEDQFRKRNALCRVVHRPGWLPQCFQKTDGRCRWRKYRQDWNRVHFSVCQQHRGTAHYGMQTEMPQASGSDPLWGGRRNHGNSGIHAETRSQIPALPNQPCYLPLRASRSRFPSISKKDNIVKLCSRLPI